MVPEIGPSQHQPESSSCHREGRRVQGRGRGLRVPERRIDALELLAIVGPDDELD
jgi:hypothetical protein